MVAASSRRHIIATMSGIDWYKVEQLPWPVDWEELFGRPNPLMVEIGFGSGLFLADMARRCSGNNYLGLEISTPSLRNAVSKVRRARLDNVLLLQASAQAALQLLCRPNSISGVIINYPDPWPKKYQLGRRLISDTFLQLLSSRLVVGANLDIATDHVEYAVQIAECLASSPHFDSRNGHVYLHEDPGRLRTKYEQIALDEGRQPHYFKWRRNDSPATGLFPILEELSMPHVVMRLPADLEEISRSIKLSVIDLRGVHIRFVEVFQSVYDGKLLIETFLNEDPIQQRFALEMRSRSTGEIVVSLAEVGFPRPTRGVHLAIKHLVGQLREEYPSLVVTRTTLQDDHAD